MYPVAIHWTQQNSCVSVTQKWTNLQFCIFSERVGVAVTLKFLPEFPFPFLQLILSLNLLQTSHLVLFIRLALMYQVNLISCDLVLWEWRTSHLQQVTCFLPCAWWKQSRKIFYSKHCCSNIPLIPQFLPFGPGKLIYKTTSGVYCWPEWQWQEDVPEDGVRRKWETIRWTMIQWEETKVSNSWR